MTGNEQAEQRTLHLYRCTECGNVSDSLGRLHAHAERHRGLFGIQLPWRYGDFDALMEFTEVLEVSAQTADLEEVEYER
jgi:hypothetical protein